MDQWVRHGIEPPAGRYPRLDQGRLVPARNLAFPKIPGVRPPHDLTAGERIANALISGGAGARLPLLVPQVDADGNELSGIRLPEIAVPLATYTGWNFRSAPLGSPDQLYPLLGSYIPFARTKAEREARGDPRPSVTERYQTRDAYLALIEDSAAALVKDRFLLPEDTATVIARAASHWDLIMGQTSSSLR
jgi:hypothetical protein